MGMSVSIIVSYRKNKERFLRECLTSICNQTRKVDQVVIIEDCLEGEEHGSAEALERACEIHLNGSPFQICQLDTRIGKAAQINRGIELVTSDYLGICSGDDFYEPAFVEQSLGALAEADADVAWSNYNVVDDNRTLMYNYDAVERVECSFETEKEFIDKATEWGGTHGMFCCLATWFGKTEVFIDVPFDPELKMNEDLEWLLRAVLVQEHRFTYVRQTLANYRISSSQISHTLSKRQLQLHNRYTWSKINMLLGKEVFPPPREPLE